jgi:hypothetical protein
MSSTLISCRSAILEVRKQAILSGRAPFETGIEGHSVGRKPRRAVGAPFPERLSARVHSGRSGSCGRCGQYPIAGSAASTVSTVNLWISVVLMVLQVRAEIFALPGRHPRHDPIAAPGELILVDFLVKAP